MIMLSYDTITMISVDIQCISWTLHNAGFVDNGFYDTVANEIDEVDYYAPMIFFSQLTVLTTVLPLLYNSVVVKIESIASQGFWQKLTQP